MARLPKGKDEAGYRWICTGENLDAELAKRNSEEIRQKYHNDPAFHQLTDWMVNHMMNKTVSRGDFVDALTMATYMVEAYKNDYGCLLNLLKGKEE